MVILFIGIAAGWALGMITAGICIYVSERKLEKKMDEDN